MNIAKSQHLKNLLCSVVLLAAMLPARAQKVTIMSYNIHHGANSSETLTYEAMGEFMKTSGADIIGLQEVDSVCKRSGNSDQMKVFANTTGMYAAFGRHFAYDGGAYGLGILSKYPMEDIRTDRITSRRSNGETRSLALLSAKIQLPNGQKVLFATVHLALDQPTRLRQAKEVLAFLDSDLPVILTGDLNATPQTEEIQLLETELKMTQPTTQYTFPVDQATKKIDYVLISKNHLKSVSRAEVAVANRLSDHLPIITEVVLN